MNTTSSLPTRGGTPAGQPIIVGWDVGGAHLKAAALDVRGRLTQAVMLACPLWEGMDRLRSACDAMFAALPPGPRRHAVTMTGEMTDLFPDRAHGVAAIVDFLVREFVQARGDRLRLYAGAAGYVEPDAAPAHALQIASANWQATASWCARAMPEGVLVDIGSTTTDLIPYADGRVIACGATDAGRLDHGELAYAGIVRTPLVALADRAPFAGVWRPTMREFYATTSDVFRVLGELDESCDVQPAADNGPKTREGSARRLLRLVGEDLDAHTEGRVVEFARWYRERLVREVADTLAVRLSRGDVASDAPLIGAGTGRFLVTELGARLARPVRMIDDLLCPASADPQLRAWAAHCAPAAAVALLAYAGGLGAAAA